MVNELNSNNYNIKDLVEKDYYYLETQSSVLETTKWVIFGVLILFLFVFSFIIFKSLQSLAKFLKIVIIFIITIPIIALLILVILIPSIIVFYICLNLIYMYILIFNLIKFNSDKRNEFIGFVIPFSILLMLILEVNSILISYINSFYNGKIFIRDYKTNEDNFFEKIKKDIILNIKELKKQLEDTTKEKEILYTKYSKYYVTTKLIDNIESIAPNLYGNNNYYKQLENKILEFHSFQNILNGKFFILDETLYNYTNFTQFNQFILNNKIKYNNLIYLYDYIYYKIQYKEKIINKLQSSINVMSDLLSYYIKNYVEYPDLFNKYFQNLKYLRRSVNENIIEDIINIDENIIFSLSNEYYSNNNAFIIYAEMTFEKFLSFFKVEKILDPNKENNIYKVNNKNTNGIIYNYKTIVNSKEVNTSFAILYINKIPYFFIFSDVLISFGDLLKKIIYVSGMNSNNYYLFNNYVLGFDITNPYLIKIDMITNELLFFVKKIIMQNSFSLSFRINSILKILLNYEINDYKNIFTLDKFTFGADINFDIIYGETSGTIINNYVINNNKIIINLNDKNLIINIEFNTDDDNIFLIQLKNKLLSVLFELNKSDI